VAIVIPPDNIVAGDTGHIAAHNNIADVEGLTCQALAEIGGVTSNSNAVNVAAVQAFVTSKALAGKSLSLSPSTGAASSPLSVIGNTAAGQLVYMEQDGSTDHVLTLNLVGTGGTSQAALNAVSANSSFSCVEITGVETGRGSLKIAHKGYADGSDANAAAISIDLQTVSGGVTGTAAQGIFITSTTDSAPSGSAIVVRYNSLDQFVVKSSGRVGIGNIAIGHTPAGTLEIAQIDTSTFGLAMTAIASGTDMVNLKDSGGNLRFQVNNSGNIVARANAFFTSNVLVGSTTGSLGGAGSAIQVFHSTDPSSNPAAASILLYCDASGNLKALGASGTVTTIAGP
jgi:hypothetical protein